MWRLCSTQGINERWRRSQFGPIVPVLKMRQNDEKTFSHHWRHMYQLGIIKEWHDFLLCNHWTSSKYHHEWRYWVRSNALILQLVKSPERSEVEIRYLEFNIYRLYDSKGRFCFQISYWDQHEVSVINIIILADDLYKISCDFLRWSRLHDFLIIYLNLSRIRIKNQAFQNHITPYEPRLHCVSLTD